MRYGPTQENMGLISDKANEKKNGVYRFRGVAYRVQNKRVTHIAHGGKVLECCGYFNVEIGIYDGYEDSAVKILRSI